MFTKKPETTAATPTNSGNRRAPAAAFLNIYKVDKSGVAHKVGAIPFENGKAIHEVLAQKWEADADYEPNFKFVLNENVQRSAEDIDID